MTVAGIELTSDQERQVKDIIDRMECPISFQCYRHGFQDMCKAYFVNDGELVECLDEEGKHCQFSHSFGGGRYCKCSLRIWVAKHLGK